MSAIRKYTELVASIEEYALDMASSVINDGTDALGIPIYDEGGNDLSENEEWLNGFLDKLGKYISNSSPPERDWWAQASGKAAILQNLIDDAEIEIDANADRILEWLASVLH